MNTSPPTPEKIAPLSAEEFARYTLLAQRDRWNEADYLFLQECEGGGRLRVTIAELTADKDVLLDGFVAEAAARHDAQEAFEKAQAQCAELTAWVNDLQSGLYVNCVYCGHRYGPGETTPVTMADALKSHIEQCPKHPMSALKAQCAELQGQVAVLAGVAERFLAQYDKLEPEMIDAFRFKFLHGMKYEGENWSKQLTDLRAVVSSIPAAARAHIDRVASVDAELARIKAALTLENIENEFDELLSLNEGQPPSGDVAKALHKLAFPGEATTDG